MTSPLAGGAVCLALLSGCATAPAYPLPTSSGSPAQMLAHMLDLGTPGPEHAFLDDLVGSFDAERADWPDPMAPPTRSSGRMVNEWILGRRYLRGEYEGHRLGQVFGALSLTGFDKSRGVYFTTSADSASTWFLPFSRGTRSGNTITFECEVFDALLGRMTRVRETLEIQSEDRHVVSTFQTLPDGSETKVMEIVYTRR